MFYKKKGFPEERELVMCTITKILPHSVFAILEEYNREGMIHISEISPGRIRNIRDFVKEGKKLVCKVLRTNEEKGHIDLSLRRVSTNERINKTNEFKQELKAEKLMESLAKRLNISIKDAYDQFGNNLIEKYGSLAYVFQQISINHNFLKELKLPKSIETNLLEIVKEKIVPPEVKIHANLKLISYEGNGVEIIKSILFKLKDEDMTIAYISAPIYRITITSSDYKSAENKLKELIEKANKLFKQNPCIGEITKFEKK